MTRIIAARLQLQNQAEEAVGQLKDAGFAAEKVTSFYVAPPGQHAHYPIGGDRYDSPGAKEAGKGAAGGAAIAGAVGAVIGAGLSPAIAVMGGLVGAHAGSLLGALNKTKEKGEPEMASANEPAEEKRQQNTAPAPVRPDGMLVAVEVGDQADEQEAIALFRRLGAYNLERAEGEIAEGTWRDFDPLSAPSYL